MLLLFKPTFFSNTGFCTHLNHFLPPTHGSVREGNVFSLSVHGGGGGGSQTCDLIDSPHLGLGDHPPRPQTWGLPPTPRSGTRVTPAPLDLGLGYPPPKPGTRAPHPDLGLGYPPPPPRPMIVHEIVVSVIQCGKWTKRFHVVELFQSNPMRWVQGLLGYFNRVEGSSWSPAWYATYSATSHNQHGDQQRRVKNFPKIFMPIFFAITHPVVLMT